LHENYIKIPVSSGNIKPHPFGNEWLLCGGTLMKTICEQVRLGLIDYNNYYC